MDQPISIFRFNFQDDIMAMITQFAKTHQNDDRKKYKEEWNNWFSANSTVLEAEITRLTRIGYSGNVEYKMFNAGRYYFRKRVSVVVVEEETNTADHDENNNKNNKNTKRTYIPTDKSILDAMDLHIRNSINAAADARKKDDNAKFTPADGYNQFCKTHIPLLTKEIKRIYSTFDAINTNMNISALIVQKFKKTYKNRYFMVTRK